MTHDVQRGTADLVGNRRLVDRLWSAARRDTLHHAYLFEGPRGLGKHTLAVRLAMAANCTSEDEPDPPCGRCSSCLQIAHGNHPDVIELAPLPDRATPVIAVDQVRELVRQAGYRRYSARRRFFLVDPAEAMQPASANALLKTLEEPPPGSGFILIANHASSLLPTIVSRCQRIRFGAVAHDELEAWLRARGVAEAARLARVSLGCPGVALALADGAIQARNGHRDAIVQVLTRPVADRFDWASTVCKGLRKDWRPRVDEILEILEDLLRDVVVLGSGSDAALIDVDREDLVRDWTRRLHPQGVARCARAIEQARENLELNVAGRLVLDAVLARVAAELGS